MRRTTHASRFAACRQHYSTLYSVRGVQAGCRPKVGVQHATGMLVLLAVGSTHSGSSNKPRQLHSDQLGCQHGLHRMCYMQKLSSL